MKKLLLLGAGTAGTMIVNRLRRRLDSDEWEITVVDQDDVHHYQPGYLFLPFGTCVVKNNTPCVPVLLLWEKYFDKVSLRTPAQHPLLEKSTIRCAIGGQVSVVSTLQIKVPGLPPLPQAEGVRTASMSLCPLLIS